MDIRKTFVGFVLAAAIAVSGAAVWAGGVSLSFMATKQEPGASGLGTVGESSLSIEAKGLQPGAVYTVWFVNMKPKKQEAGAGTAPYMFKTDSSGSGRYESSLAESPFDKWAMIMIVRHPMGDPTDMKNMVPALSAEIPKSR